MIMMVAGGTQLQCWLIRNPELRAGLVLPEISGERAGSTRRPSLRLVPAGPTEWVPGEPGLQEPLQREPLRT